MPMPISSRLLVPAMILLPAVAGFSSVAAAPQLQWFDRHDGGAASADVGTAALCDPEGDLIVGGESPDGIDGSDMLVRKFARGTGALLWSRRVPSFDTNDMALSDLAWDGHGNVLVGGYVRGCVG
jgi:hypothetical protein